MPLELNGILQIAIPVRDIHRATAFYRDVLGLPFLFAGPNMAFFDCNGVRLYLDANQGGPTPGGNSLVYFRTADIEKQAAALKQHNAAIFQAPQIIARLPNQDLYLMWFRDSEDNLLGIMEERKK